MKVLAFMRRSYRGMIGLFLVLALSVVGVVALRDGAPWRSGGDVVRGGGSAAELEQLRSNLLAIFEDCETVAAVQHNPGSEAKCRAVRKQVQAMSQEELEPYASVAGPITALRASGAKLTDWISRVARTAINRSSDWVSTPASATPGPPLIDQTFPNADYTGAVGTTLPKPNASDSFPGFCAPGAGSCAFTPPPFGNPIFDDPPTPCGEGIGDCAFLQSCIDPGNIECSVRGEECAPFGVECLVQDTPGEFVEPPPSESVVLRCSFFCQGGDAFEEGFGAIPTGRLFGGDATCSGTCVDDVCSNNGRSCDVDLDCVEPDGTTIPFYNEGPLVFGLQQGFDRANIALALVSIACEQTILGFDLASACIPFEIALAVFETLLNELTFCDDENLGSEINASYARLEHIHANLRKAQTTLDTTTAMEVVHVNVIQVEEKKHYLVSVTEAGEPVSGAQLILLAGAPKKNEDFLNISITTFEWIPGVLDVTMNSLPSAVDSDTIFQWQVQHGHADDPATPGDDSFMHFGTALIGGDSNSTNLGSGH